MMVTFPQIDDIIHGNVEKLDYVQREYLSLLNKSIHFINSTFDGLVDRISRNYESVSLIKLLELVSKTLHIEETQCQNEITYDDFVKNAIIVSTALKKIINSPSKRLVKVEKYIPAINVTYFDTKTMTWLSRRPGVSIEEKISPKNKIPTRVTQFTMDTPENRHTMYLYDVLYDNLYGKVYPNGKYRCENCPKINLNCAERTEKLNTILMFKNKIKITELYDVPKQKQIKQNNKLLSDKEYKQIWDAVRDIDYFEMNCKTNWFNLKQRYQFLCFLFITARIANNNDIKVYDSYAEIIDYEGALSIRDIDGNVNKIKFYSESLNRDIEVTLIKETIEVKLYNYIEISYNHFTRNITNRFTFGLGDIFKQLDEIHEKSSIKLDLDLKIKLLNQEIKETKIALEDLGFKQGIFSELGEKLWLLMWRLDVNEQEKENSKETTERKK